MPYSVSLHEGPQHVCIAVNDLYRQRMPGRRMIGLPMRESSPEARYREVIALMDEVWLTGRPRAAVLDGGLLMVMPRMALGRIRGVALVFEPPPRVLRLLPAPPAIEPESTAAAPRSLVRAG